MEIVPTIIEKVLAQGRTTLTEYESKELLKTYNIPITREFLVRDYENFMIAVRGWVSPGNKRMFP